MDVGSTPHFNYTKDYQSGILSFEITTSSSMALIPKANVCLNPSMLFSAISPLAPR